MPLDLHPDCVSRIREGLADALGDLEVRAKQYVDYQSAAPLAAVDAALPDHGPVHELLESILGEEPLTAFVLDRIGTALSQRFVYDGEAEQVGLQELGIGETIPELADRIMAEFLTLPWRYTFMYRLPDQAVGPVLSDEDEEFGFTDEMSLIQWTETQATRYPVPDPEEPGVILRALALAGPPSPVDGAYYFRTVHEGYIPEFGGAPAVDEAERALRAICGIGFALGVWERGWHEGVASLFGPSRSHVYVWLETDGGREYITPRELPTELGEAVSRIRFSRRFESVGDVMARMWATEQFARSRILFASDEGLTIARACRWLFDSYVGSNELLSFIQATVSAEILLGDKATSDITGITELLANRCAYLVGETRQQRETVLQDFRDIYQTRSRIVHRGLDQLSPDDRAQLWRLRLLCTRIIERELELLTPRDQ